MVLQAVTSDRQRKGFNPSWPGLLRSQRHRSERNSLYIMRCFIAVQELCRGKGKEGGRLSQFVLTDK